MDQVTELTKLAQYGYPGVMIAMVLLCALMAWLLYKIFIFVNTGHIDVITRNTEANTKLGEAVSTLNGTVKELKDVVQNKI